MNIEKLTKIQDQVRIGGKGTPRRKKKIIRSTIVTDQCKLQSAIKKLSVSTLPGIEEVNMIKNDGTVLHLINPKTQASLSGNTFVFTGHAEEKKISDLLPGILYHLDKDNLKRLAVGVTNKISTVDDDDDDDVPELVNNFDEASKSEVQK